MSPAKKSSPGSRSGQARLLRWGLAGAATLALVAGLVAGIARLGDEARRGIGPRDRYAIPFAEIICDPPPGRDRATFLAEVRYASGFPETFQSLDPELNSKLTAAFTAHPWVAAVVGVTVDPGGVVRVGLRFREPALAVTTSDGARRAVDATGVLLPDGVATEDLPLLATPVSPPRGGVGTVWGDATIRRALELLAAYHPRRLEKTPRGWRLTRSDGRTLSVEP